MVQQADAGGLITLSTGVVLRRAQAASFTAGMEILREEAGRAPKVAMKYDADAGKELPDEQDPAYLRAVQEHNTRLMERLFILAAVGLRVAELPEDLPGPDSEDWQEQMELTGFIVEASPLKRFLRWLHLTGASTPADFIAIVGPLLRQLGVPAGTLADAETQMQPAPDTTDASDRPEVEPQTDAPAAAVPPVEERPLALAAPIGSAGADADDGWDWPGR